MRTRAGETWRGENGGGSLSPVDRDPEAIHEIRSRTLALPVVLLRHAAFA